MHSLLVRRLGMGLSLLLLTGATFIVSDQTATPAWRAEKIWQDDSTHATGDVSADGRLLTFIDSSSGPYLLSVRDLVSRTNRVLVPQGRTIYGSVVSPDGTQVAFRLE